MIEVPEAPEAPKPDRITKDSVVLSWRPPRFDGGAKIKEYILEQKKRGESDWSEVICPTIYSTLCTVIDIVNLKIMNVVIVLDFTPLGDKLKRRRRVSMESDSCE